MIHLQTVLTTGTPYREPFVSSVWAVSLLLALAGCGGASPAGGTAGSEAGAELAGAEATAGDEATAGGGAAASSCVVVPQQNGTRLLYSDVNDWWFYVEDECQIDCSSRPGVAMANNNGLLTIMTAVAGEEGKDHPAALNEFLAGYKAGVSKGLEFDEPLEYEEKKLGEHQRPAHCANVPMKLKGQPARFVICVTSAENANGDFLAHTVQWVLEEEDYLENEKIAWEAIQTRATSWYLQSDTDDDGNLVKQW